MSSPPATPNPTLQVRRWRWLRWTARLTSVSLVAASFLAPVAWIEGVYSDGAFPAIQHFLVPLSGSIQVPIMGLVLLVAPILLVAWAVRGWRSARRRGAGALRRVIAGGGHGLLLALYVYTLFLLIWGFGYRRVPVEVRWGIEDRPASLAEVAKLRTGLLALIHRDCASDAERDRSRARRSIEEAQALLVEELEGFRPVWPEHVKSPPKGSLLTIEVAGVVSPWTLEAHVDAALLDPQWLATCGHELAHLAGYCGEADANLVGFVSGLRAEDAFARYSTALGVFQYTFSSQDSAGYRRDYASLPERAKRDLDAARKLRAEYVVESLSSVSSKVYDQYLKSQGMASGTGDYSRGFRLFVRAWAKGLVSL